MLGNAGGYEESNTISRTILQEDALARRFGNIADGIYNMAYNYRAQCPPDYDEKIWRTEVQKSAMLFHIMKSYKLEKILENIKFFMLDNPLSLDKFEFDYKGVGDNAIPQSCVFLR